MIERRFVFDTNVLISALLLEHSVPAQALRKAEDVGIILYSYDTFAELSGVLQRPKFSRYITLPEVEGLLARIHRTWKLCAITHQVRASRDPKDDKFLELALGGNAETIVSGDSDLLVLAPYREIAIVTPAFFLAS